MNSKLLQFALLPCLAIFLTVSASLAASLPPSSVGQDALDQMMAAGWTPVAPGVLERKLEGHRVETFAMGPEGFTWVVRKLQAQLGFLLDEHRARPTAQLRKAIRDHRAEIAKLQSFAEALKATAPLTKAITGCNFSFGADADAYPTRPTQGVQADADAYFGNTCGYIGNTYAYAYATATLNGVIRTVTETHPNSGPNVSSHATASVAGDTDCYSYGYASVTQADSGINYSYVDENFVCPPNLTVTINGLASVTIWDYACRIVTWTSTVSGGTPNYSYAWYIDGVFAGSGSSLSRTYCGNGTAYTNTENVSLTVTDSLSLVETDNLNWTASDTHTTNIVFRVSDPCLAEPTTKALPQPCCVYSATGLIICPEPY